MTYAERIKQLTLQYNEAIRGLERSYKTEKSVRNGTYGFSSSLLREQYSDRYDELVAEYRAQSRQILQKMKLDDPSWAKGRTWLGRLFVVGLVLMLGFCHHALPAESESSPSALMDSEGEVKRWSADDIPIPYLQDATQYVSNPDNVLSAEAVGRMNATLKRMEDSLQVQTVVIAVNHIANDDPFRMAQDVGNRYGVGYGDRGLVIVLGYLDHSINMSPGRSLEADLTDAECHRLQQRYVVPAMRAEMPDSGMIYLVEAIYSTLQNKQLPQMSRLVSQADQKEDQIVKTIGVFIMIFIGWCLLFLSFNSKYQWLGLVGGVSLLGNPFIDHSSRGGGFYVGGSGGGGFGGGGGFSGGNFGGGSFGGGGATSRW